MIVLDNHDVKVWYSNTYINMCVPATIKFNQRCDCRNRINIEILCKHEYKLNGNLDVNKYDNRCINQTYYLTK